MGAHTVPPCSLYNLQDEATGFGVSHEDLGVVRRIVVCFKALPPTLSPITSSVLPGLLFTLCYIMHVSGPLLSETGSQ